MKSLAALTLAPLVTLRKTIDREKLLAAFCDDDNYRYDFAKPFGYGSLTYATDSRFICRAEIADRKEDGDIKLPYNFGEAWPTLWKPAGEFLPLELPPIEALTLCTDERWGGICPLCGNRRVSLGDCYPPECSDYKWCDVMGYDPDDNTIRDKSCGLCHGKDYHGPSLFRYGPHLLSYHRMKPIAALPNTRVAVNIKCDGPLLFQADGFEGMAMGLREKGDKV